LITRHARLLSLLALLVVLAGCGGSNHSTLSPESKPARSIANLFWVMMGAAWVGFGVIAFLLLLGWFRRGRVGLPFGHGERTATGLVVGLGVLVPIVVLSILFVWSDIFVIRSTAAPRPGSERLTIDVIGHQWFWEVRYPGTSAVTANEIHIPVRTPVRVVGTTADVIHSFWVPDLNRKIDLIPGQQSSVLLEADKPGVYRGRCAEFCGLQHAHMELSVIAERRTTFAKWLSGMGRPARAPEKALARRGLKLFQGNACAGCHTIRGTSAQGRVGPDLTHLATRQTLAALAIPNTPQELTNWIRDPQDVKPGSKMPGLALTDADFRALIAYLETLN
jgi:cytochrome c oxidase subunit 2